MSQDFVLNLKRKEDRAKGVAMRTLMFAVEDATLLPIPGFKY